MLAREVLALVVVLAVLVPGPDVVAGEDVVGRVCVADDDLDDGAEVETCKDVAAGVVGTLGLGAGLASTWMLDAAGEVDTAGTLTAALVVPATVESMVTVTSGPVSAGGFEHAAASARTPVSTTTRARARRMVNV